MRTTSGGKEPDGDDAEGEGASAVETLAPTRSDLARWGSPTLQLPIGLPPPLHLAVDKRRNVLCSRLSASRTKLQPIR
jgi:hypothetical protein